MWGDGYLRYIPPRWRRSAWALVRRLHFQSRYHIPVSALGGVLELADGIPGGQALDAPLFGHNVLVASHDEDFGVSHHCRSCIHAADTLTGNVKEKCCRGRASLPNAKI